NKDGQAIAGAEGTLLRDAVRDMDEAGERERKRRIHHQRHGKREGDHMRVGGRQVVGLPESADVCVAREVVSVDADIRHFDGSIGQAVPVAAAGGGDGSGVETAQPGSLLEPADAHAPRMLWPQTRMTWPLTPAVPGWPSHATVSATSTGSPPWLRLLMRRPISRVANGLAFVIAVSMKPVATALMGRLP